MPHLQFLTITRAWMANGWQHLQGLSRDLDWDYWDREHFERDLPEKWELSFRAEHGGSCVGYVVASRKGAWIWLHHIITAACWRGRGAGSAMLEQLETRARALDVKGIRFKVSKDNQPAIKFYRGAGYAESGSAGRYWHFHKLYPGNEKLVAVHQPNFIPWAGYFYKMMKVDDFIFLDDVLTSNNSFINRNRIKQHQGALWLTVPVRQKLADKISDVGFADPKWSIRHGKTLRQYYSKTPYFDLYFPAIERILQQPASRLVQVNVQLIEQISEWLGITCTTHLSSDLGAEGTSDARLINIVKMVGGQVYVSGKGGSNYQSEEDFRRAGIRLVYSQFAPQPYPQLGDEFVPGLSILDLLFNCGPAARDVIGCGDRGNGTAVR